MLYILNRNLYRAIGVVGAVGAVGAVGRKWAFPHLTLSARFREHSRRFPRSHRGNILFGSTSFDFAFKSTLS